MTIDVEETEREKSDATVIQMPLYPRNGAVNGGFDHDKRRDLQVSVP